MIILLIIGGIILGLLLIPVGGETISENGNRQHYFIWAGLRFRVKIPEQRKQKRPEAEPRRLLKKLRGLSESESKETAVDLWDRLGMELSLRIGRTLRRFYHCLHIRVHKLDLTIGFSDPAATGLAFGAACAAASALPASIPLRLTADFVEHETKLDYRITLLIIPAQIVFEFLRAAVTLHLWEFTRFGRAFRSITQTRRQHV